MGSVFDTVERNFHGKQAVYFADCCYSGSLAVEAGLHQGCSAVLASAHVSSKSTGIHYDGFPDGDDEWMDRSRLKTK